MMFMTYIKHKQDNEISNIEARENRNHSFNRLSIDLHLFQEAVPYLNHQQ